MDRTLVHQIMTTDLISIERHLNIDVALELMHAHSVRRLPVVGPGMRLIGILTEKDVRIALPRALPAGMAASSYEELAPEIPTVGDVMAPYVYTLQPDQTVAHAAEQMANHKISGLPVVDNHKLVGIVTEYDIFRFVVAICADREARHAA